MKKQIYQWHRRLGIVVCIPLMLWALSGICHPLMNWVQPDVATSQPDSRVLRSQHVVPLHEVLGQAGIGQFEKVRLVYLGEQLFYQVRLPGNPVLSYWDAQTGEEEVNGDERYAAQLAHHFLGDDQAAISTVELLESYTSEYREINRLLPVYRVKFDRGDGIRLFVETGSSRLGTTVDNFRGANQTLFWIFHNFGFLSFSEWLNTWVLLLLALASLLTGLGGIVIFGFTKQPRNSQSRMLHRYIGIGVSVALLMFSAGAAAQIWSSHGHGNHPQPRDNSVFIVGEDQSMSVEDALTVASQAVEWTLVKFNGQTYHRLQSIDGSIHYLDASTGLEEDGAEERYARALASRFGAPDVGHEISVVRAFTGEYGFVNKRLPVVRLAYDTDNEQTWYIETWTGHLAASFDSGTRLSGMLFVMLHKWHFLDSFGTFSRDVIMILFCLLIAATAGSGLWIFARKR